MQRFQIQQTDLPHYTFQDYKKWDNQWELIGGIPFSMFPLPSKNHQRLNKKIVAILDDELLRNNCEDCEAFLPIDWKIDDDTIVQPDVSIICNDSEGQYVTNTPKLVFEILSPSTRKKDLTTKFNLYQIQGVKYYCIVDPEVNNAKIYQITDALYQQVFESQNDTYIFNIEDCDIVFDFSKIWK
jgi:Uma2 family endonuclease